MFKTLWMAFCLVISVVYILNPSAGMLELIPDNIPVIGNLDEAAAVVLLLTCLRYFGFDLTRRGSRKYPPEENSKKELPR